MNKEILIINKEQFGYHTDSYKYCEYLREIYNITYLCFDMERKKVDLDGVEVIYVPYSMGFIARQYKFLTHGYKCIKNNNYDLVFAVYFKMVSLLKLSLSNQKLILDIRTGEIEDNKIKKRMKDFMLKTEARIFDNITIISSCLMNKYKLTSANCHILPVGSDRISKQKKNYSKMRLLYVGTLHCRNIHDTITGLGLFMKKNDYKGVISYDIFGDGSKKEKQKIIEAIKRYSLSSIVKLHDRKNHDELKPYFDKCNLGISYVPITSYYDCQPPTKTFEYVNSGLPCIATQTTENKNLINEENGVLCKDTPESFSNALEKFYKRRFSFKQEVISRSLSQSTWKNIVNNNLYPYLRDKIQCG